VQDPYDTQAWNRYAYVRNNPLNTVDPSGYFFKKLFKRLWKGFFAPLALNWAFGPFLGGGLNARLNGGHFLKGGIKGAISGALFHHAGAVAEGTPRRVLIGRHMRAGAFEAAADAAIHGNSIGKAALEGAITGGASKFASTAFPHVRRKDFHLGQATTTALAGGISGGLVAKIYGGSFDKGFNSGAERAASGYAFNWLRAALSSSPRLSGALNKIGNLPIIRPTIQSINRFAGGINQALANGYYALRNRSITIDMQQLQHEFKHAARSFGVDMNWSKVGAGWFKDVILHHVRTAPEVIKGTYRGTMQGTHYFDPKTSRWVFKDASNNFHA